jgi:hypothetical protein
MTSEHRHQQQMLYWLSYVLSPKAYHELWPGFVEGVPHKLLSNHHNNDKQYKKYRKRGNLSNTSKFVVTKIQQSLNQGNNEDAHISWLEYAASTINFAAVIVVSQQPEHARPYPPMAMLFGDNTTANWVGNKGTIRSDSHMVAQAVARVHGGLQQSCNMACQQTPLPASKTSLLTTSAEATLKPVSKHCQT